MGAKGKQDNSAKSETSESDTSEAQAPKDSSGSVRKHSFIKRFRENSDDSVWWTVFIILIIATATVRFYKIHKPAQVCWDETHFGRFANLYLNRKFHFDVHPPLGKMIVALFGYVNGYNGTFVFEVGKQYGDLVPYVGMRILSALMGAAVVPMLFLTVWQMTSSLSASAFTAIFLIFDSGMVTINRFVLLDPLMLFFISGTVYGMAKFELESKRPFGLKWWLWLSWVSICMTCAFSVKFVGLFTVLLVGVRAIYDLWVILGDMSRPVSYTVKHFIARAICLILLPVFLYMVIFYVHLKILKYSGEEDEFFSTAFQVSFEGNHFRNAEGPKEVAYGAAIRLKNNVLEGQYLHSHKGLYPVGARQQQITLVDERDPNNLWFIKRHDQPAPAWNATDPIDFVRHGDLVRLQHRTTGRNLHVYGGPAPVTENIFQVTGYGWKEIETDPSDVWRLDIAGGKKGDILQTVFSDFQLISATHKCVLTSTGKNYPEWGYGAGEVACHPKLHEELSVWHVDENRYPRLPNVSYSEYELNFFGRFVEAHSKMLKGNNAFRPKLRDFQSRPWMWPLNLRGQFFSVEGDVVYLLGNPLVWFAHCLYFLAYFAFWIFSAVLEKRKVVLSDRQKNIQRTVLRASNWIFIGFLLHYVPFWPMVRILYIHHYFPALLFSNMLSGVMLYYLLETFADRISPRFYTLFLVTMIASFAYTFYLFSPLAYGYPNVPSHFNHSTMYGLKWMPTWEF